MTVIVKQSAQVEASGILRRWVTGTAAEVAVTLDLLRHSGALVSASVPKQLDPTDPTVTVMVRVREARPANAAVTRPSPERRWVKPLVIGGSVLTVIAGLIVGGYLAAQQIVSSTSGAPLAALGLLALVVGFALLVRGAGRKGVCVGLHCSGCGHH